MLQQLFPVSQLGIEHLSSGELWVSGRVALTMNTKRDSTLMFFASQLIVFMVEHKKNPFAWRRRTWVLKRKPARNSVKSNRGWSRVLKTKWMITQHASSKTFHWVRPEHRLSNTSSKLVPISSFFSWSSQKISCAKKWRKLSRVHACIYCQRECPLKSL